MTNVIEQVQSQMEKDSEKIQQAIADYNSFIFWCTEIRGMSFDTAKYCWRHRHD